MAVHERNRAGRVYHGLVSVILLLAGGALLGSGIWLRVTDNAGPLNLEYAGDNVFSWALNFGIGLIIIGGFLLLAAVASLLALARNCVGTTFKIIYVLMLLVIFAVLVFICVISIIILTNNKSSGVQDFLSSAWERTVSQKPEEVCNIEKSFECRGFLDNDCKGCELGSEVACGNPACANCGLRTDVTVGCYDEILDSVHSFFLPTAITSGILAVVVLIDALVACVL